MKTNSLWSHYAAHTQLHVRSTSDTSNGVRGQSNIVMCSQWLAAVSLDDGCERVGDSVYQPNVCRPCCLQQTRQTVGEIRSRGIVNTLTCCKSCIRIYGCEPRTTVSRRGHNCIMQHYETHRYRNLESVLNQCFAKSQCSRQN